ncbi:hypothetical protein ASNO1_02060 [Corallococcus caeni]|uniref:Uncharacterized protein n=1 Tax=Corallococcus caeni TaxID=3082388 RepID=A0ABQ6QIW2_9BACT|nr:hypothetical protein ASNO1_02060 [Corallococcus sp. NO1]
MDSALRNWRASSAPSFQIQGGKEPQPPMPRLNFVFISARALRGPVFLQLTDTRIFGALDSATPQVSR